MNRDVATRLVLVATPPPATVSDVKVVGKRMDFRTDLEYSERMRDMYLVPGFYEKYAYQGRYVFINKTDCSMIAQKSMGVDSVMQRADGRSDFIEEKIERWPRNGKPRTNFFLETHSYRHDDTVKACWMTYSKADYLLYAFEQQAGGLLVYYLPFQMLKTWFEENRHQYETRQVNQTVGVLVPIADVLNAVPYRKYNIPAHVAEAVQIAS